MNISVAMTTYKSDPEFLRKQLDSICDQTLLPDEVVIVDDFSQDETADIVQEYIDNNGLKNWKLIREDINRGFIGAFKVAIMNTSGEYIFLCDHDDIWLKDKVEFMHRQMRENIEMLALSTAFQLIDLNDEPDTKNITSFYLPDANLPDADRPKRVRFKEIVKKNKFPGCSMVMRKEIKEPFIKYYTDDLPHDYLINLLASLKNGLYFINCPTFLYRIHNNNLIGIKRPIDSINNAVLDKRIIMCRNLLRGMGEIERFIYENVDEPNIPLRRIQRWEKFTAARINYISKGSILLWLSTVIRFGDIMGDRIYLSFLLDGYIILRDHCQKLKKLLSG